MGNRLEKLSGWRVFRTRPAYLMISLFLLLLVNPALQGKSIARLALSLLFTLIMFSAALAVSERRRGVAIVFCLGVPWIAVHWVSNFVASEAVNLASVILLAAFSLFVLGLLVTFALNFVVIAVAVVAVGFSIAF